VNRQGFLVGLPVEGGLALYSLDLSAEWDEFTVAALFPYQGGQAALIYRDDVFSATADGPPPERAVWGLAGGLAGGVTGRGFEPEPLGIPAFEGLPPRDGWDIESFRPGRDGFWYYRAVRRGKNPAVSYYRAADPAFLGEKISLGVFRNAQTPYNKSSAPSVLRAVLDTAAELCAPGEMAVLAVSPAGIFPELPGPRYFGAAEGEGTVTELAGFYIPPEVLVYGLGERAGSGRTADGGGLAGGSAGAVFPDGRLVYADRSGAAVYALPVLPGGFVYTRLAVTADGGVLAAAWEEQQDWSIGAAGFMVINAPWAVR
jgi:hypothetical protein